MRSGENPATCLWIDVESGIVRQGNVAFEMRNIAENEIVRTEETDGVVCGLVVLRDRLLR